MNLWQKIQGSVLYQKSDWWGLLFGMAWSLLPLWGPKNGQFPCCFNLFEKFTYLLPGDSSNNKNVDCGWPGILQSQCEGRGCCWRPGKDNPWCHYPHTNFMCKSMERFSYLFSQKWTKGSPIYSDHLSSSPICLSLSYFIALVSQWIAQLSLFADFPFYRFPLCKLTH